MAGCRHTREIAAELALGIAEGQQRSEALEHLATCASCRAEVDHLAATADSLLLLAPSAEPPAGFESTVLDRLGNPPPVVVSRRRSRRWTAVAAAAAAVVVVFVIGLGVGRVLTGDGSTSGSDSVAVGTFAAGTGSPVGEVRAITGEPSWLFVAIPGPAASPPFAAGDYQVECIYRNGYTYHAGTLTIDPDEPVTTWSTSVGYPLDNLEQVRLVGADGQALVADLEHPS
jgi:hypothetical protein